MAPEKSFKQLQKETLQKTFLVNTIGPALCAKYFLPKLHHNKRAIFAALSARVGSISDNRLGGWYGYRASKAALNMIIKNLAIEYRRMNQSGIVVGLHPGTVDTHLSKPYQGNVPNDKLFTPDQAAQYLHDVINKLKPEDSGGCFDWAGKAILP